MCGGVLHGSSSSSRGGWWFWFWWFHTVTHEHGTMLVPSSSQIDRTRASPPPPQHPRIVDGSMSSRGASPPAAPGRAFVAPGSGRFGVEWALAHGAGFPTLRNTAGAVAQPAGGGGGACDEPLQTPTNKADFDRSVRRLHLRVWVRMESDPFEVVHEEARQQLLEISAQLSRWHELKQSSTDADGSEATRIKSTLSRSLGELTLDLQDLQATVNIAGRDPAKYSLTQQELDCRRKFVLEMQAEASSVQAELDADQSSRGKG